MRLFLTLSKKTLAIFLAVLIIALLLLFQFSSMAAPRLNGSTHSLREAYLNGLGLEIDGKDIKKKEILIPPEFNDVYKNYNYLQQQAGFNLEKFKGQQALLYTYKLKNDSYTEVHLIIKNGEIIGGDICDLSINGKMKPLKNPDFKKK